MAYVSDGGKRTAPTHRSRGKTKVPPPKSNAPRNVQTPPGGDIASSGGDYGTHKAKRYSASAAFRKSVRQAYVAQTPARRKQVSRATERTTGPAAAAIRHEHRSRINRNADLARGASTRDIKSDRDLRRGNAQFDRTLQKLVSKSGGEFGDSQTLGPNIPLSGIINKSLGFLSQNVSQTIAHDTAAVSHATTDLLGTNEVGKTAARLTSGATKNAMDAVANFVPNIYKFAKTDIEEGDKAAAKLITDPYVNLYHHPEWAIDNPLDTAFMVVQPLRAADRLAGRAARAVPGKPSQMASRARAPKVRPGTSLAEERLYPKGLVEKGITVLNEKRKGQYVPVNKAAKPMEPAKAAPPAPKPEPIIPAGMSRADWIKKHAKARPDEVSSLDELTQNVKPSAKPGVSIHDEHILEVDPVTKKLLGHSDRKVPGQSRVAVMRDNDGNILGAIRAVGTKDKPILEARVADAHQRKGIAKKLYDALEKEGYNIKPHDETSYTEAGAAAAYSRFHGRSKDGERVVEEAMAEGAPVQPKLIMSDKEVGRRVDEFFGAHEHLRRNTVASAHKAATKALGRKATPSQILAAQNIIDPTKSALSVEHQRLIEAHEGLINRFKERPNPEGAARIAQSEKNIKAVEKELGKFDPKVFEAKDSRNPLRRSTGLEGYKAQQFAAQQKLGALTGQQQGFLARSVMPFAVKRMGATLEKSHTLDKVTGKKLAPHDIKKLREDLTGKEFNDRVEKIPDRLVNREGKPIPIEDILNGMDEAGVSLPAWVSHSPSRSASSAYYSPSAAPPNLGPRGTTGQAQIQGTFDVSNPRLLHESAARTASLTASAQSYSRFLEEFGHRDQKGRLIQRNGKKDADQLARDWNAEHPEQPVQPIRANAFGANGEQLHALMDHVHSGEINHDNAMRHIEGALTAEEGAGPWVLVPAKAAQQAAEHMASQTKGVFANLGNLYGSQFRKTVLALSPKWMTGNIVEAAFRTMINDAPWNQPANVYRGYKFKSTLKHLDPTAYREFETRVLGGGHGGMQGHIGVYTDAERFAGTKLANIANAMAAVRRNPGGKQVGDAWNHYTDFVFNTLNGNIETGFQTAMLGKILKDHPLMEGNLNKLSQKAIEQAAQGARNTNTQVALGRAVDDMFGKYGKYSASTRQMIARYTPFIPWMLNSFRFLTKVLPRDHPLITTLAAALDQSEKEWRKEHGIGWFLDTHVPDFIQGSIPEKGGKSLRASRYLPFGFGADPLGTVGQQFAPQFMGIVNAAGGKDWKGDDLPGKNGPYEMQIRGVAMASAFLGASVPAAALAQRALFESNKDSPIGLAPRHDSALDRLRGEFDPFKPTEPGGRKQKKKVNPFDSSGQSGPTQSTNPFDSGGQPKSSKKKNPFDGG